MAVHGGRNKVFYLYVSCCCKTFGSFQTDNAGVLELTERLRYFLSLSETLQCRKSSQNLTDKTPSKKENNKLRKLKVLRHGNTGDKLASQKPAKTVTPAFSFDCNKCGQVWTSNVVFIREVKVSLTKGKIHALLCKR